MPSAPSSAADDGHVDERAVLSAELSMMLRRRNLNSKHHRFDETKCKEKVLLDVSLAQFIAPFFIYVYGGGVANDGRLIGRRINIFVFQK